jgi:hypothetical protein
MWMSMETVKTINTGHAESWRHVDGVASQEGTT